MNIALVGSQTMLACIFIFRWEYGFITYLLAFVWGL
jgi:hypothetical protein